MPGGAGHKTEIRPSLWWLLENIAKTFLPTKKVGSPCDNFSHVPGIARHMRRTLSRWSSSIMRRLLTRAVLRQSALMLRVCAALELLEVGVAFVLQFLFDADLRSVIAVNGNVLDRPEEPLLLSFRTRHVLADLGEDGDLLVFGRLVEWDAVLVLTQFVHRGQTVSPGLFDLVGRLADH